MLIQRFATLLLSLCAVLALSACGSSCNHDCASPTLTQAQERNQLVFGSPGMVVPDGQTSLTITLQDCQHLPTNTPVTSATLVVGANGDMIFSGVQGTASLGVLARRDFADSASLASFDETQASIISFLDGPADSVGVNELIEVNTDFFRVLNDSTTLDYLCERPNLPNTALLSALTRERVLDNIVLGATGDIRIRPDTASGARDFVRQGDVVSWDTGRTGTFARFVSINLQTLAFGQGSTIDPGTHTPVVFSLPSIGGIPGGFYTEVRNLRGDRSIFIDHDNISLAYLRFANPAANGGFMRELVFSNN